MRILKSILLVALPLLLVVNLYRFGFFGEDYEYHGFHWLVEYFSTFPGLTETISTIQRFGEIMVEWGEVEGFFEGVENFFNMVGTFFNIFVALFKDIFSNISWVIAFIGV